MMSQEIDNEPDQSFADRCKVQPALIQPLIAKMLNAALLVEERCDAARELTWSLIQPRLWHECLSQAFCNVLVNPSESSSLRGQAGEGLAELYDCHFVKCHGRTRQYRRAGELLIAMLSDPSPEVRFWSCFALGKMRYRLALCALNQLADKDPAVHDQWWSVGEEAADAIGWIKGRKISDRELRLPN